jgi:hypothetical protein
MPHRGHGRHVRDRRGMTRRPGRGYCGRVGDLLGGRVWAEKAAVPVLSCRPVEASLGPECQPAGDRAHHRAGASIESMGCGEKRAPTPTWLSTTHVLLASLVRRSGNSRHKESAMKYLLQIYAAPSTVPTSQAEGEALMAEYNAFTQSIIDSGELVAGEQVARPDSAVSVTVRDGKTATTNGPFAETAEGLGGFYIVDVKDIDRAVELAAKIPNARNGTVEVRPIVTG